jgi:Tfp pilus assembly protein PilV
LGVLGFVAHAAAFRAFKRLSEQWRIAVTWSAAAADTQPRPAELPCWAKSMPAPN